MALIRSSAPSFMTAEQAAQRQGWRAKSELELRNALEQICRDRWPAGRVVHELVMGAREVRADVVAIDTSHIAAFEVKGYGDNTSRLMHQVGMYQLCVPEVWIVAHEKHADDARLIRHLLPSVGLIIGTGQMTDWGDDRRPLALRIEAESAPRPVVPEMMLEMLWANELRAACARLSLDASARTTRPVMIKTMLARCSSDELMRETCTELRARNALWRADAPIVETAA